MAAEFETDSHLEIAHVLFVDIVGYSNLLTNEQRELLRKLNNIVRATKEFRTADSSGKLLRLPTGDGMALAFFTSPDAPVRCALEIAQALKDGPKLPVRMGIHSGPVDAVSDVDERANIAGAGINMAQRVMDCGDAGHILLSKRAADDLAQHAEWRSRLHELGDVEVKHGQRIGVSNFYFDGIGNPALPEKLRRAARARKRRYLVWTGSGLLLLLLAASAAWMLVGRGWRRGSTAVPDKSIAVLPFENLSKDDENAYFAGGVQDEILSDLAKVADVKVISRTSVMLYKAGNPRNLREIGQQLGVANVLEGSVQRAGNRVRVNAQLVDTRTDKHLWAQSYDRDLADVFAIQSEIAQKIAEQLEAKISPREKAAIEEQPTRDLAAYDLYVRAIALMDRAAYPLDDQERPKDDLEAAVDLLNQAIARDPAFLLAYCWLARAHDTLYFQDVDRTPGRFAAYPLPGRTYMVKVGATF